MPSKTPNILTMLQQLIAAPSVSCTNASIDQSNKAVIGLLDDWFTRLGFSTHIQTVDAATEKYNLIASIGSGTQGLVLSGHTDTVPCDDELWQHDPFTLVENDNRFYGLGIADMKSFFALVIEALREIDLHRLKQPLIILATCDEETGMAGAKAIARHGLENARYAVIGEPTSLRPVRMHKGITMQSIRLTGQSGHSSDPALGRNALESMHKVITELMLWRDELQSQYHDPLFAVPVPTINFGHIHGGDNPNRICGQCELQIDIRPLPGMHIADLNNEMQQRLKTLLQHENMKLEFTALFDGIDAMQTSASSELVKFAEQQTASECYAAAYSTEAPYYNAMGIETIVLGPGNIEQAHQPDEYLALATINPYVDILRQLIHRFCY
jgi:acetylornithine deacetylase